MRSLTRLTEAARQRIGGPWPRKRLAEAYDRFYAGKASKEDADLILQDIAKFSLRTGSMSPDEPTNTLWYCEGRRSVFDHMVRFRSMKPEDWRVLEGAIQEEMLREYE